ncbi:EamA family transporter [Nordella sp. HKS 07]|uniref:EamA family transporter n=1 Tax=Nordella sp. HKS 07 TaxID=2712222 RepID=UPI0013E17F6B|nr:EamA family transporter [Nordella sp. HKS 07]
MAALLRRPLPKDARSWLALCGIGFGARIFGYLGMSHAAEFVSPGLATIVANSQPLIAAILAWTFCPNGCARRSISVSHPAFWE